MKYWLLALSAGLLMATPVLAGDPRGSHGGGHGGGHHPPAPPPSACCNGGGNTHININVNGQAVATAYAGAGSHINAHAYDLGSGGFRSGGGVVYGGGGYGGTDGGYYAGSGGPIYAEPPAPCGAPPSAPFGYAVRGMGRDYTNAPVVRPGAGCPGGGASPCQSTCDRGTGNSESQNYEIYYEDRSQGSSTWTREDRGGRYGYGERHDQDRGQGGHNGGGHHPPAPTDGWVSYGCGCGSSGDGQGGGHGGGYGGQRNDGATQPVRNPEPAQPHRPRQEYRQEPGERG